MTKAVQITLVGRVQGVGIRYWVVETARKLALNGWVCNELDRSVRIWAEGEAEAVDALVNLCETPWLPQRPGHIESVGVLQVAPVGEEGFHVRWR
ncbi:MAG: acylphosphatase [Propionibacteriaceae bacterium]|nr:acylphosphatase [Propionibacteriaceae bacterium]